MMPRGLKLAAVIYAGRRRRSPGAAAVAAVMLALSLAPAVRSARDTRQVVPNAIFQVVDRPSGSERRVAIFRNGSESGSIAVPPRVSASALAEGLEKPVWHPNGDDVALGFKGDKQSFVVVFLVQPGGTYVTVDVSQVEAVNVGRIGPDRSYRNLETVPTGWLRREQADSVQVWLQTTAWDLTGQRYRTREPLIIMRDGRPLWR
jgi:hypothetical protein